MNDVELIARAEHAQRLLNDPLFIEAMESLKAQCLDATLKTEYSEDDKRRELWALARNADKFKGTFERFISEGRAAELAILKKDKDSHVKRVYEGFFKRKKGNQE